MTDITWHEVKGDEVWEVGVSYLLRHAKFGYYIVAQWSDERKCWLDIIESEEWENHGWSHYAKIREETL